MFTFVYPDAVSFDSYSPRPGGYAQDLAGSGQFVATAPNASGISYMALSPDLHQHLENGQLTLSTDPTQEQTQLERLAQTLNQQAQQHPGSVLEVQTWGDPKPNRAAWGDVGNALKQFGGTPSVWDALDGTGNYALVGTAYPNGMETPALRAISTAEDSRVQDGSWVTTKAAPWAGTLRGVLGRGLNSLPILSGSSSLPDQGEQDGSGNTAS